MTDTTTPPLLDVRNATLWRDDTRVFDALTLRVDVGERVAILGPNGSGKTTLLKTLNREIYPVKRADSHLRVLGRDDWNVWQLRQQIGLVSHDLHADYPGDTTVIDVVVSGFHASIGVHGILADRVTSRQRERAREVIAELGIDALADRRLADISTGQQRRCFLARALVHSPHTLILDEPTAGMDMQAAFEFVARLRALDDCNIVLVTHHVNEIPPETERVIGLRDGAVFCDGAKADILTADVLSGLFDTPIRVIESDGYFLAYPGHAD